MGEFAIMGLLPNAAGDLGISIPRAGHATRAGKDFSAASVFCRARRHGAQTYAASVDHPVRPPLTPRSVTAEF